MNYELAKQLKEAGFPFRRIEPGMRVGWAQEVIDFNPEGDRAIGAQHFFEPTFEEIVEACGWDYDHRNPRMLGLTFNAREYEGALVHEWIAMGPCVSVEADPYETKGNMLESGSTPKEAVAALFIALYKK